MKIALFADSLPPSTDGVARTYVNLANTLEKHNIDFQFISPFKPGEQYSWNDRVTKVVSFPLLGLYRHYRIGVAFPGVIEEQLDRFKPDIIHTSSPTIMGHMAYSYAVKNNIPAVSTYHTDFVSYFKYYGFGGAENLGWSFLRWFYNHFQRIFVPSLNTKLELESQGFKNVALWQRGIDITRFSPEFRNPYLRQRLTRNNEPVLLFVGRLVKEKDLDDLVDVNQKLRKQGFKFQQVIVGDGPMREELEKKLPQAIYTGFLYGYELSEMYASSDIFVFPSTTETFGNVILEANASGLPAVIVNKGGVQDLVKDGITGFVAEANNTDDITGKVSIFLSNPSLRGEYAHSAQAYARQFDWDAINSSLLQNYQEVIRAHRGYHRN